MNDLVYLAHATFLQDSKTFEIILPDSKTFEIMTFKII